MGAVYQATQLSLNRPVAIEVLPAALLADAEANFAARFRQEALTMAKLTHPGIVDVFESGERAACSTSSWSWWTARMSPG
jgi:serine/threonine-protein kinase